jgi:uncharacterized protein YggU (UPF0235/DUF167 family)
MSAAAASSKNAAAGATAFPHPSCVRAGKAGELFVQVCVKPGAKQTAVTALNDTGLHVRVSAAPIDGAANTALLSFLADALSLRKSSLSVGRGTTSRTKTVVVDAQANGKITANELDSRIAKIIQQVEEEDKK